jgi:fibronectin type 3 domain-containing protein
MKTLKYVIIGLLMVIAFGLTACGVSSSGGGGNDKTSSDVPKNVSAEAGNEQVTIRWDNVAGTKYYNIYWDLDNTVSKKSGTKIYDVLSPFVDINLTNGTEYFYVVTAVTADGESDESKMVSLYYL